MTYTRAWDETQPLGSAARNTVDDIFRNLKVDMRERLNVLVDDWTADPVVPKATLLGNVTGKIMNIHWSAFMPPETSAGWVASTNGVYFQDGSGGSDYTAPVILPPGAVITEAILYVNENTGLSLTFTLRRVQRSSGSASDVSNSVVSTPGYQGLSTGAMSHTVDSDYIYYLLAATFSGNRVYGATIIYNVADARITL